MPKNIREWTGLDNAAKIFPPSQGAGDTKVFRVSCELKETVDESALVCALEKTAVEFPGFMRTIRRGAFWYYLEECYILPKVHQELLSPCSPMRFGQRTPLFDVSYYNNRIHLEVYHALTDGTGAMQFLRVLVAYYLKARHPEQLLSISVDSLYSAPDERSDDSFRRYYDDKQKTVSVKEINSYHLRGLRRDNKELGVIEGSMSTKQMLDLAHAHNTKMTIFVAALFLLAIEKTMSVRQKKRPVVVTVPINLRSYFDSQTTRNFFSVVNVGKTFVPGEQVTLDGLIEELKGQFEPAITRENMYNRLNNLSALENNLILRLIPLRLKDWVMRAFYMAAEKKTTVALTNLGRAQMPVAFEPYVQGFSCLVSTMKMQIGMCSFGDEMRISFTSTFQSTPVERHFFRLLASLGVGVSVTSNREEAHDDEEV